MRALVLVADADPFELRLLSELCMALGCDVVAAADGGGVLDVVARDRPRLVVMDQALRRPSGFEVLEILRGDPSLCQLPVVLATREGDDSVRQRGSELGATAFVTKPYRTAELHQRLDAVLGPRESATVPGEARASSPGVPVVAPVHASELPMSLEYEFTRAARYRHPLGCVVVRMERPRSAGGAADAAQEATLVAALRGCLRSVDQLFRCGPGDFTILLPETGPSGCEAVVERLHAAVLGTRVQGVVFAELRVASSSFPRDDVNNGASLWQAAVRATTTQRT